MSADRPGPIPPQSLIIMMAQTIRVNRRDDPDGCSYWISELTEIGYPQVRVCGNTYPAHRLACILWLGPAAVEGKDVHHTCEHRHCVNPEHLVPVTASEHVKIHKGLISPPVVTRPPPDTVIFARDVLRAVNKISARVARRMGLTQEAA